MTAGLIAWAAAFAALYALHGIGCAAGWPQAGAQRLVLTVAWLAAIAGTALLALRLARGRRETLVDRCAVALGWVGRAATVVCGLPIVVAPACI